MGWGNCAVRGRVAIAFCLAVIGAAAQAANAQSDGGKPPDMTGTWLAIKDDVTLPGGLRNSGSPEELVLTPVAVALAKEQNLKADPALNCHVVGPFRLMARPELMFDLLPALSYRRTFMTFEDWNAGRHREIFMEQRPPRFADPKLGRDVQTLGINSGPHFSWQGSSVGRWEGETLVVETTNHSEQTWLNSKGARHSDKFRTTERYRLVGNGQHLEVRVTAEDPMMLEKPYSYTRYFQKVDIEIPQINCWDDLATPVIPEIPEGYPEVR